MREECSSVSFLDGVLPVQSRWVRATSIERRILRYSSGCTHKKVACKALLAGVYC